MKYAHDYSVMFSVYSDNPNEREITDEEIIQALRDRIAEELAHTNDVSVAYYEATFDYETGEYINQKEVNEKQLGLNL